ncbi:MAG: ABC transporter substrate-binding protein [Alphaproteobacteria bacterium]|nr:ABC transporter substrate-binding protein [Alphaproteobacteria bacterium]
MKRRLSKIWIGIAAAAVVAVVAFALGSGGGKMTDGRPVVKIGLIFPLTGNSAHLGHAMKGAAEIAVLHANKNPGNRYEYRLITEDSRLQMPVAANIANKMVSVDRVDAMLSFSAEVVNVVSAIAERGRVIHFGISVDRAGAKGRYNFINWTMPEATTQKMTEIIKARGFKNVAIISLNQSGSLANSEMLRDKLSAAGIKNSLHVFNGDVRDFKSDIARMRASGVDIYVLRLFDPMMSIFIRQLREAGDTATITSIEMFNTIADPSIIEGLWFVDTATAEGAISDEIMRHSKSEVSWGIGQIYDNVMMIVHAFEVAPDRAGAIDVLVGLREFDGVVGRLVQDKDGIFHSSATLKEIRGGRQVIIK